MSHPVPDRGSRLPRTAVAAPPSRHDRPDDRGGRGRDPRVPRGLLMRARRVLLFLVIAAVQFAVFEVALRTFGHSEAAPSFQALFMPDPIVGYRLRPDARTRFVT